jgi:hypothetical protein
MAWVVTAGHKDVIIGTRDYQEGCNEVENPDLEPRTNVAGSGNVREITGSITANTPNVTRQQNTGNGPTDRSTVPLMSVFDDQNFSDHSMNCLTVANGKSDNDNEANPSEGPAGSAVGSAPKCDGMAYLWGNGGINCTGYPLNARINSAARRHY